MNQKIYLDNNATTQIDEKVFSKLTEEQKKKVESAKTPEELLAIAEEAGYELTEKELSAICGGQGGSHSSPL